jgi:hypothetical protein
MAGTSDDQSIRLDEAFREVSAQRGADPSPQPDRAAPPDPAAVREATELAARRRAKTLDAEALRSVISEELHAALATSDVLVEVTALAAAVDDLRRRVEELCEQLEEPRSLDAAGGSVTSRSLRHGLRSMSPGRPNRVR